MRRLRFLILLLCLLCLTRYASAAGFSISAEVDRTEVGFGESLNLILTVSQDLSSGMTQRLTIPAVNSIPGFDIAGTRSGQSTTFVNGVGQTRSQILYELVPQKPGKITIPAFSFKDPDGQEHSTKPVEVTVRPPEEEEKPAAAAQKAEETESSPAGFSGLLFVGLVLGCIVALPFILSAAINRRVKPSTRWADEQDAAKASIERSGPDIEEAVVLSEGSRQSVAEKQQKIDFIQAVSKLKREYSDADSVFFRKYFELFRDAAMGECGLLRADMTFDEQLRKICEIAGGEGIAQASRRLAADLEMVLYANRPPARSFAAIDSDAREILNAISD